jgi:hypothetical protein
MAAFYWSLIVFLCYKWQWHWQFPQNHPLLLTEGMHFSVVAPLL